MTAEPDAATGGRGTAALYTLLSVMFINMLGFGVIVPFLPFYAASFHATGWQIGLVFSAYSIGSFVGEPFWGKLSDRIGRKPILISTVTANCLCYGALAFAPNIWFAILIRVIGGMAAGNGSVVQGYIADVTPVELRAGRMARLGAAYNLGFILGPFVGGTLVGNSGTTGSYHLPLLMSAALCGMSALGITLVVKESRKRRQYMGRQPSRWVMFGYAARHPVVGRLMLLTFAVGVAFTAIESTFALWAQHRFGWQPRDVGLCFGVTGAVSACCQFLLTGPLSRRFGEGTMLAVGMAGTVICTALQPFSPGGFVTVGLMALMALSQSVAFPNSGALLSRSVDPDHQGQIMGLNNATGALARITGPQLGLGLLAFNINGAFYLGAMIVAPAIFLAMGAGRAAQRTSHVLRPVAAE
ncbi:MAG TPA: MFS transporter [Caulobacteraceae bacterium]|jgi:MFS family permease|nr:MFS transporter [Caulobacteraceae bacterium]